MIYITRDSGWYISLCQWALLVTKKLICLSPSVITGPVCRKCIYCHSHPFHMIAIYKDFIEKGPLATLQLSWVFSEPHSVKKKKKCSKPCDGDIGHSSPSHLKDRISVLSSKSWNYATWQSHRVKLWTLWHKSQQFSCFTRCMQNERSRWNNQRVKFSEWCTKTSEGFATKRVAQGYGRCGTGTMCGETGEEVIMEQWW